MCIRDRCLGGVSGFIWRVGPDRVLVYRDREDREAVGVTGLSDDPLVRNEPLGEPLELTVNAGGFSLDVPNGAILPAELSWGGYRLTLDTTLLQGFSRWVLRAYHNLGHFRSDPEDYKGIILRVRVNNSVVATYDMSLIVSRVQHEPEVLFLDFPQPIAVQGGDDVELSFSRAAASFELPDDGHRVDASKVKNHVRVFGRSTPEENTQLLETPANSLNDRIFPIPPFARIPGEDPGIRVVEKSSDTALTVVSITDIPDDDTTYDVVWDRSNSQLTFNTSGPVVSTLTLTAANAFYVTGFYGIPVRGVASNRASIAAYGGTRSLVLRDASISDAAGANRRAKQELDEWDDGLEVLQGLTTDYEDFEVGTLVWVHSTVRDLNSTEANFVIEDLEITGTSPRTRIYKMKLRRDNFVAATREF